MTVSVAAAQQRPHSVLPAHHTTTALPSTPTASSSALAVVVAADDHAVAECATPVVQQPCTSAAQNAMPNEPHVTTTPTTINSHGSRAGQQRRMSGAWEKGGGGGGSRQPSQRGGSNITTNNNNSSSERRRASVSSSVSTHTAQQQQQPHNNKLSSSRRGSNATTTTSNDGAVVIQYALPTIALHRGSGRQRRGSNTGSSNRRGSETRRASLRKASIPSTSSSTRPAMQHRVSGTWDTLPEQHYEAPGSPIQLRPLRYLKQHGQPTAPMHQFMAPVFRQTLSPADLALLEPGLRNKGGGIAQQEKEYCSLDRNHNHYGQTLDTTPDRLPQQSLQGDTTQYVRPLHDTLYTIDITHHVVEKKDGSIGSGKSSEVQPGVWTEPPMREELRAHTPSSPTPHVSPARRPSRQQQQDTTTTTSSCVPTALVMGGGGVTSEGKVPSQSQSETQRNVQAVEDEAAKIHRAVAALVGRSSETAQQQQQQHYNTGGTSAAHIAVTHEGSNGVHLPQLRQQHSQQRSALTPSSHSMSRQPAKATSSRVEAMPPLLTASNAIAPYSQQQQYGMPSLYKGSEGRLYGHLRGTASASSSGSINSLRDILRREPQHGQTPTHHNTPSSIGHSMQPHERPRSSRGSSRCSSHLDDVHHNAQPTDVTTTATSGEVGPGVSSSSNGNGNAAPQVEWTPDISPQWIRTPLPRVLAVPEEVPTHTFAALAPQKGKEAAAAAALPMPHILPMEEKDTEGNATPRPAQRRRPAERNNKGKAVKRQQEEDSRTRRAVQAGRPPRPPAYKATPAVMNGIMLQRSSGTTKRSITPTQQQKQKAKGNGSTTSHYGGGNNSGNSSGTDVVCVQHMPPLLPMYASHTDAARIMRRANTNSNSEVEEKTRLAGGGVSSIQGVLSSLPVGSAAARYAQYAASLDVAAHGPRRVSFTRQGGNEGRSSNINTPPVLSTMKSAIAAGPVPTPPYYAVQDSIAALPSSSVANGSNGGAAAVGTTMLNSSHVRLPLVLRRSSLLSITGPPPTTITSATSTPTITSSKVVRGHMPGCSPAVLTPVIRGHTPHRIRRPLSFHAPQDEEDGVRLGEKSYNNHHHSNGTERDKKRHSHHRQRHVQASLLRHDFSMYAAASNHHRQQHRSRQGSGVEKKALHVLPGHKCAEEARRRQLYGEEDGQRDRYAHLLTQHGFWGESTRCL